MIPTARKTNYLPPNSRFFALKGEQADKQEEEDLAKESGVAEVADPIGPHRTHRTCRTQSDKSDPSDRAGLPGWAGPLGEFDGVRFVRQVRWVRWVRWVRCGPIGPGAPLISANKHFISLKPPRHPGGHSEATALLPGRLPAKLREAPQNRNTFTINHLEVFGLPIPMMEKIHRGE